MAKADVLDIQGERVGEIELKEEIFGVEVKPYLIHDVIKMQLANRRRGTASTKGRSEVAGSGKKAYRQKGTGRARHGNMKSPTYPGGGVAFGPKPRDYSYRLPRKVRRGALRSALTLKYTGSSMTVLDRLELPAISTKQFSGVIKNLQATKPLFIIERQDDVIEKSARNIPYVKVLRVEGLNVYDVMRHGQLIMTVDALRKVEEVLLP
jgi:large subunit ribosomal protein L4